MNKNCLSKHILNNISITVLTKYSNEKSINGRKKTSKTKVQTKTLSDKKIKQFLRLTDKNKPE